ncbi:MAG: 23S rRNA (guanosine(2251)-2'-O)-methyltransferase RlmB [Gammaproteobacteria bacterium]|nr:23S rRNA (guanosine(2251)-2'-O)-methyltransferase RlmB [Gammaproteobacteria bacterium]
MGSKKADRVYGQHAVRLALENNPQNIYELWVQGDKKLSAELSHLIEMAKLAGISVQEVSRASLDRHSGKALHQGVMVRQTSLRDKKYSIDELLADKPANLFLLILDGVQDPHNLGACLRTANAAGADAVIIPKDNSASLNATVSKVASGAAENTPLIQVSNLSRALRQLKEAGVWIIGTAADGTSSIYDVDLTMSLAIVMGGEGRGLRQNTRKQCDYLLALPMKGVVESLNVSVASGICLYEVLRQKRS